MRHFVFNNIVSLYPSVTRVGTTLYNILFPRGSLIFFLPSFGLSFLRTFLFLPRNFLLHRRVVPSLVSFTDLPLWWPTSYTELSQRYDAQVERALEGRHSSLLPYLATVDAEIAISGHRRRFPLLTRYIRGIFTLAANRAWVTAFLE